MAAVERAIRHGWTLKVIQDNLAGLTRVGRDGKTYTAWIKFTGGNY